LALVVLLVLKRKNKFEAND